MRLRIVIVAAVAVTTPATTAAVGATRRTTAPLPAVAPVLSILRSVGLTRLMPPTTALA